MTGNTGFAYPNVAFANSSPCILILRVRKVVPVALLGGEDFRLLLMVAIYGFLGGADFCFFFVTKDTRLPLAVVKETLLTYSTS